MAPSAGAGSMALAAGSGRAAAGSMKLRSWETGLSPSQHRCRPPLSARSARPSSLASRPKEASNPLQESLHEQGLRDAPEASLKGGLPLVFAGAGVEAGPADPGRFYGSLAGPEVQKELSRQHTLVKGLSQDLAVVKNSVWHLEDERRVLQGQVERLEKVVDPSAIEKSFLDLQAKVELLDARATDARGIQELFAKRADRFELLGARVTRLEKISGEPPGGKELSALSAAVAELRTQVKQAEESRDLGELNASLQLDLQGVLFKSAEAELANSKDLTALEVVVRELNNMVMQVSIDPVGGKESSDLRSAVAELRDQVKRTEGMVSEFIKEESRGMGEFDERVKREMQTILDKSTHAELVNGKELATLKLTVGELGDKVKQELDIFKVGLAELRDQVNHEDLDPKDIVAKELAARYAVWIREETERNVGKMAEATQE